MNDEPYCLEGEGHRCSYSPTGYCKAGIAECAKATGCVMPDNDDEQVAPI
jgi:hypothetical protein